MNILIIGGTKFVGKAIAAQAALKGHDVTLFNRGQTDQDSHYKTILGDVDQIVEHRGALRKLSPDVVIHAIAYNERHGLDIVEIFQGTATRLAPLSEQWFAALPIDFGPGLVIVFVI